jgi:hypothetical protein
MIPKQSPLDIIVFIFSPFAVILLFVLVFMTFTDHQAHLRFHDQLMEEGRTVEAELYNKEDKNDKYGTVFRASTKAGDDQDVFFVIGELLPDEFYTSLEVGETYEVRYLGSFGMFTGYLDEYRHYVVDFRTKLIVALVCLVLLTINPRVLLLGFDTEKRR